MTPPCRHEQKIAASDLPEELRRHLETCATCGEIYAVALNMQQLAVSLSAPLPTSAAQMWWRLELRMRRDRASRAQAPLIWMMRIFYVSMILGAALLGTLIPNPAQPILAIGLSALAAVALPIALALWGWSRSNL